MKKAKKESVYIFVCYRPHTKLTQMDNKMMPSLVSCKGMGKDIWISLYWNAENKHTKLYLRVRMSEYLIVLEKFSEEITFTAWILLKCYY